MKELIETLQAIADGIEADLVRATLEISFYENGITQPEIRIVAYVIKGREETQRFTFAHQIPEDWFTISNIPLKMLLQQVERKSVSDVNKAVKTYVEQWEKDTAFYEKQIQKIS